MLTRQAALPLVFLALLGASLLVASPPAKAATLAIFESVGGSFLVGPDISKVQDLAQSFNATANYHLLRVDAMLYDLDPSNPLNLTIETDAVGVPSGTTLATGTGDGVAGYAWTTFDLGQGVNLTAGTTYWIVLQDIIGMNQPGGYKWAIKSPDQYAGGHYGIRSGGGAWVPWTDGDLLFRNWGLRGPQVAAGLSVDSASAGVGDPLAYTVFLNNTGTTPAPIVWANLTLSPNTTYDSDTAAAAGGMVLGPFSWGFADVGIGPHSFQVAVHVNAQIFDGLPLDAKIAMDYTDQTGALQEHTEATTTVTARTPSLTISKSVDPTFVGSDENVNYTITIVNSGSRPSPYVWVNDTLPQEVSYRSNNASALANYSSGGFDGLVVHANFSNLPRGSFSFDILARTRPGLQNGTVFTNIATADYTDKRGIRTWPTVTASATARIHGASVVVENVASLATAEPGQDVRYRIRYDNRGDALARWVWVNDTLSPDATYVSDTGGGAVTNSSVRFAFADVAIGLHSFTLDVRIRNGTPDGRLVQNLAILEYENFDGQPLAPSQATAALLAIRPVIAIGASGLAVANPGDAWNLVIDVTNRGNATALGLWVNLTVPAQLIRVSDDAALYGGVPTPGGWYFGPVPSGAFSFAVRLDVAIGLANGTAVLVTVDGAYLDGLGRVTAVAPRVETLTIKAPVFTIGVSPARSSVSVGETNVVEITYSNVGTGVASDVWINVTIPDGAALVSASEPWSATTGYRYTWHLGSVAPGTHEVSLTLRADGVPGAGTSAVSADLAFTDVNRNFAGRISASGTFQTSPAPVPVQTWMFLGLFALIAVLSTFIGYRVYGLGTRDRAQVQQLFLLHKSGLLIKHYTRTLHGSLDSDILAAMLVAVQNLVRESFHFKAGDLEEMKFGSHKLLLAHGQSVILVAIVSGRYLDRLKVVLATGITRLEGEFGDRLRDWDGLVDDFRDIDQVLDPILHGRSPARNGNGKGVPNPRNSRW